jgi:hypothetical protein
MPQRLLFATWFSILGLLATTGISEAAKGPDASDVALGTFAVVLGVMAFLGLVFLLKMALGGVRPPPPEEPSAGAHH